MTALLVFFAYSFSSSPYISNTYNFWHGLCYITQAERKGCQMLNMFPVATTANRLFADICDELADYPGWKPTQSGFREFPDRYELEYDVPGFNKENLEVTLSGANVAIRGKTETRSVTKTALLPSTLRYEKVESRCKDGVLTLLIYKSRDSLPKKIAITDT